MMRTASCHGTAWMLILIAAYCCLRFHARTWGRWSVTRDNGELRLALRLLERNLPWVRRVFVVSNGGAAPSWLADDHPRATVVDADALVRRARPDAASPFPKLFTHTLRNTWLQNYDCNESAVLHTATAWIFIFIPARLLCDFPCLRSPP